MLNILRKIRNFIKSYTMSNFFNLFLSKNLRKSWKNLNKENFSNLMIQSMNKYLESEDYKRTSTHHKFALIKILQIIEKNKNEESSKYFQFNNPNFHSEFNDSSIDELLKIKLDNNIPFQDLFKTYPSLKLENSLKLNLINNLIYNNLRDKEVFKFIDKLKDNTFIGNGKIFNIQNNIKITQEKMRSLLEYENIADLIKNKNQKILEIGSGNGRICETILSINQNVSKYVLLDIPPALTFAYERLKKNFTNKKICYGIDINSKSEFDKMYLENDILLLFPGQSRFFSKKMFDLCIAIDCLHEMKKNTVKEYMKLADSSSSNLYFKVHKYAHVPFSFTILNVENLETYFIKKHWKLIYKKKSFFPSHDYELAFKL